MLGLWLALRAFAAGLLSCVSILKSFMVILMHTTATDARTLFTYHFLIVSNVINHIIIPLRNRFAFLQFSPGGSDSFLYVLVCVRRIRSYPRICLLTGRYGDNVARVLWRPRCEAKTQRTVLILASVFVYNSVNASYICAQVLRSTAPAPHAHHDVILNCTVGLGLMLISLFLYTTSIVVIDKPELCTLLRK